MPFEMRSSNPDPANKDLVVFVHGFGSDAGCWKKLLDLFNTDDEIIGAFDLATFSYPTAWFNRNPLERIPRIAEIGRKLGSDLNRVSNYREVTLVGHSQGGLVIQSYLVDWLNEGKSDELYPLRQVILIATPNLGSLLFSSLRKFVSLFSFNPQERALRVLDPEISDIRAVMESRVVNAKAPSLNTRPIPVQVFYGLQDGVVLEASARGIFQNVTPVDADHFSILTPGDRNDERYKALAHSIKTPVGHRYVFEVDLFEQHICVEPLPPGFEILAPQNRIVQTDNVAHLERAVTLAETNTCTELFELRYRTRNNGFIKPTASHPNEAPSQVQSLYEDYGTEFSFQFTPKPKERFGLRLEVYKGFDEGHRDVHFHLRKSEQQGANYKKSLFSLDLTAYLKAGYALTKSPNLYLHDRDIADHNLCETRVFEKPVGYSSADPAGRWEWHLQRLRRGVIDIVWDLARP
jgi:pimeloyl-ACP methyl ester carboxylesterase